jgi:hypothetical protein
LRSKSRAETFFEISRDFKRFQEKKRGFKLLYGKRHGFSAKNFKKIKFFSKNILHFVKVFAIIHIVMMRVLFSCAHNGIFSFKGAKRKKNEQYH